MELYNKTGRSILRIVKEGESKFIRKEFIGETKEQCFQNEKVANDVFKNYPWMSQWIISGNHYFSREYYHEEQRLDKFSKDLSQNEKVRLAINILEAILEMYSLGYCHRDLHAKNIFVVNNQVKIIDFETMVKHEQNQMFLESYDLLGKGLESPFRTDNMCYIHNSPMSLQNVLGVSLEEAIEAFKVELKDQLIQSSKTFNKQGTRHITKSGKIYSSFCLPDFQISSEEAQRNNSKRFEKFKLGDKDLNNKTVLDLGSNTGGVIFHMQRYSPKKCIGIEYDQDKVNIANKITAFTSLKNVAFMHSDIDNISFDDFPEKFDIVFCLSINAHVKNKGKLIKTLGRLTGKLLIFEGNEGTNIEAVKEDLKREGFEYIEDLGFCDDDILEENNRRPVIKAYKA